MYGVFFPNLSSVTSEKYAVTPNFLFGFKYFLLRTVFLHSYKPRKKAVGLVGKFLKTRISDQTQDAQ